MSEKPARDITYRQLIAAGEPFRLLFPIGVIFGLLGVALWPAFAWGLLIDYPGIPHARIMLHGFMAAFVMGFLGTALPRLLEVPRVRGREVSFYALGLLATGLLPAHAIGMLHIVFIAGFGLLTVTVATRVIFGHCGQSHRFKERIPAVIFMAACFLAALALRLWGEFALAERFTLYAIAGLFWMGGLFVWALCVLPQVGKPDTE